ncbi:MAG: hypothetical protein ABI472_10175 [Ginsengibacter sp.]
MKKLFYMAAAAFLISCNNKSSIADKPDEAKGTEAKVTLPFNMVYEGTPAIGKTANIATVMNFNGDFIAGKMDNIGSYLADSVHVVFADGTEENTVRDSIVAHIKEWRELMTDAKQSYISAVAVDNKDKGDEWVFQWIDESHDYKDGKKEHNILHEDYRLVNGKIREAFQYAQAVPGKK